MNKLLILLQMIKKRWFISALTLFGIAFVVSSILSVFTPTPPPNPDNQWRGVAPGFVLSEEKALEALGEPLSKVETPEGARRTYKSDYPIIPHEVVSDTKNKVVLIKEYLSPTTTETVADYNTRLGKADLSLYVEGATGIEAHVFLKTGLILINGSVSQIVREKWYFTPTTEEFFFKTWGSSFTREPSSHPEPASPPEPTQ
jgi:hypothetical protein